MYLLRKKAMFADFIWRASQCFSQARLQNNETTLIFVKFRKATEWQVRNKANKIIIIIHLIILRKYQHKIGKCAYAVKAPYTKTFYSLHTRGIYAQWIEKVAHALSFPLNKLKCALFASLKYLVREFQA